MIRLVSFELKSGRPLSGGFLFITFSRDLVNTHKSARLVIDSSALESLKLSNGKGKSVPEFSGPEIGTVAKDVRWLGGRDRALDAHRSNSKMDDGEVIDWLIEVTGRQALHSREKKRILLEEMGHLEMDFRKRILAYLQEKEAFLRRLSEQAHESSFGCGESVSASRLSSRMTTNRPLLLGSREAIVLRLLQSLNANGGQK